MDTTKRQIIPVQAGITSEISLLWSGGMSLPRAYWLHFILLLNCIYLLTEVAVHLFDAAPIVGILGRGLLIIYYTICLVGVWRSSENYTGPVIWSAIAKLILLLPIISIVLLVLFFSSPAIMRFANTTLQPPSTAPTPTPIAVLQHPAQAPISSVQLPPAAKIADPPMQSAQTIKQTSKKIKHAPQTSPDNKPETHCINNCFVFEAYHDEMDPHFKPYRITMDSVGIHRVTIYRDSAPNNSGGYGSSNHREAKDLDYYLNKIPKTVRDLAPMKALRLAKELQNNDQGIYPSQEEQATNRFNDKLNTIKTNQFLMNQKIEEINRNRAFGM
jgi:hypothetical protein